MDDGLPKVAPDLVVTPNVSVSMADTAFPTVRAPVNTKVAPKDDRLARRHHRQPREQAQHTRLSRAVRTFQVND